MSPLPAQCLSCGHEFASSMLHFEGDFTLEMTGNRVPCPRCGDPARVIEGEFDVRGAVVELVSGPGWTREVLQRLQGATARAQKLVEDDPIAAVEAITAADQSLRKKAWDALGSGQLQNFLAALGIAVALLLGSASLDGLTAEDVEEIVERALEQDEK